MDIFLYQYPLTVVLAVGFMLLTWIVFRFAGSTLVRVLGSWKDGGTRDPYGVLCLLNHTPHTRMDGADVGERGVKRREKKNTTKHESKRIYLKGIRTLPRGSLLQG